MSLQPTDAALEGFRVPREQPRALLAWITLQLISSLLITAVLILSGGDAALQLMQGLRNASPNAGSLPIYAAALVIGLAFVSFLIAAVCRATLRAGSSRFGYLRFGADELRVAILLIIYTGVGAIVVFVSALVVGFLAGLLAAFVQLPLGLYGALSFIPLAYVWIRLSLGAAQTIAERRLSVFDSWDLTKGHFWALFLTYVIAFVLDCIVYMLGLTITAGLAAAMHGGNLLSGFRALQGDLTSLAAYFTPATVFGVVFWAVIQTLLLVILIAPTAVWYRQLSPKATLDTFA